MLRRFLAIFQKKPKEAKEREKTHSAPTLTIETEPLSQAPRGSDDSAQTGSETSTSALVESGPGPTTSTSEQKSDASEPMLPGGIINIILEYSGLYEDKVDKKSEAPTEQSGVDKDRKIQKSGFFSKQQGPINIADAAHAATCLRLQQLLQHVIYSEVSEAQAIIKNAPDLIFYKSLNTIDPIGNEYVDYSAAELVFYTHDIPMIEMIERCIKDNPEAKTEFAKIGRAAAEAFFKAEKEANAYRPAYKMDPHRKLVKLILNEDYLHIEQTFQGFKKAYGRSKIIRNNKSFDIQSILAAYFAYYDGISEASPKLLHGDKWLKDQFSRFWIEGVGLMQRSLPASYVRQLCQEETEDHKIEGSLIVFDNDDEDSMIPFYSKTPKENSGLGFDYAVWHFDKTSTSGIHYSESFIDKEGSIYKEEIEAMNDIFLTVYQAKKEALKKYLPPPEPKPYYIVR